MAEFPSITLYDSFNRPNNPVYTNATELWGTTWVQQSGTTNVVITSEKLNFVGDNSCLSAKELGPDVGVALTISTLPTQYIFTPVRIKNGGTTTWNGYGVLWGPAVGEKAQIRRYTSGSSTTLKESSTTFFVAGDSIGFTAIGKVLTAWRWHEGTWSELVTVEDSTYTEKGKIGLWSGDETGRYDEYRASTITSGKHEYTTSVTETLSPSQTVTRSTAAKRSSAETLSPSQTPTRVYGSNRKPSESLSLSDSVKRAIQVTRTVAQTQSTTDVPSFGSPTTFFRSVAEALSASDAVKRVFTGARTPSDTLTTSDQPFTGSIKERGVTETLVTSDAVTRSTQPKRAQTETLATSDSVKRSTGAHRSTTEALSASDSPSRVLQAVRAVTDTLSTSDAPTLASRLVEAFVTESLSTSDLSARIFHGARLIADSLSTSDTVTRSIAAKRSVSQSQSTSDAVARVFAGTRKVTESLSTSDSNSSHRTFFKSIAETLTTSDLPKRTLGGFIRKVAETLSTIDTVKRVYHGFRSIADRVTGTDEVHANIVTIYNGERQVELRYVEPEYQVIGAEEIELFETPGESVCWVEGENTLRINIFNEDFRINKPNPDLHLKEILNTRYAISEYDDRVQLNLEADTSHVDRSKD